MTLFSYRAINEDGGEVHGSLEASTIETARDALADLNLEVIDVEEAAPSLPSRPAQSRIIPWSSQPQEQQLPVSAVKFVAAPEPGSTVAIPDQLPQQNSETKAATSDFLSLSETIRLYCGWLIAWYALFVGFGYYKHVRALPWDIPVVESFYLSPLIFSFMLAIFLFLMLSSVHRLLKGGVLVGGLLSVVGIVAFIFVRASAI